MKKSYLKTNKILTTIIFCAITLTVMAQEPEFANILTKTVYVVFLKEKPVKVYATAEDCINFCEHNQQYANQPVNLYYVPDTAAYEPPAKVLLDDLNDPTPLPDKLLAKKTAYVVLTQNFANIADRVYINIVDGKSYIDNFRLKVVEVPYYYRNKNSYDYIYRQKRAKLKIR